MYITNYLTDLCFILAVLKYKDLKIAATKEAQCFAIIKDLSNEKRKC